MSLIGPTDIPLTVIHKELLAILRESEPDEKKTIKAFEGLLHCLRMWQVAAYFRGQRGMGHQWAVAIQCLTIYVENALQNPHRWLCQNVRRYEASRDSIATRRDAAFLVQAMINPIHVFSDPQNASISSRKTQPRSISLSFRGFICALDQKKSLLRSGTMKHLALSIVRDML